MTATGGATKPPSPGPGGLRESAGRAFKASLSLGIALGCFDLTMSIVRGAPPALANLAMLSAPLAVSTGAFFLAALLPHLIVALPRGRFWAVRRLPLMAACATTLGCGSALAIYYNLTRAGLPPGGKTTLFLVACLSLALGAREYVLRRARGSDGVEILQSSVALAVLPLLGLTALGIAWARAYLPAKDAGRPLPPGPAASARDSRPIRRIILLSVDTLRRDAVSALAPAAPPTPGIDSLAGDSVVFDRAYSPAPWTLPAFVSMMTGVSPEVHGVKSPRHKIPETLPALAEELSRAGFRTAAIGHNPWLRPEHGMARGFASYDICPRDERGSSLGSRLLARLFPMKLKPTLSTTELTDLAVRWLREHSQEDFFLWLHYLKPHGPYEPPPAYRPSGKPPAGLGFSFGGAPAIRSGSMVVLPGQRPWVRSLYEGEVRYTDDQLGRVLSELKRLGLYADALIVFVSDHGEEFWEHGSYEHGHSLYDELLRVPFFIKLPRPGGAHRRGEVVSTGSLAPTLRDLLGLPGAAERLSYGSLRPLLEGAAEWTPRPVSSSALLYYEPREAIVFEAFKYLRASNSGKEELFDLAADSLEQRNLAGSAPDWLRAARQALAEEVRLSASLRERYRIRADASVDLKGETLEQLRSLGYVQ